MAAEDARLWSAAAQRNRAPILAELQRLLPPQGTALEIASGSGEHALYCAAGLPGWRWQTSDADPRARASIAAHAAGAALPNLLLPPLALDVLLGPWPRARFDLVFCANLLHIAPWACCGALMRGAAGCLAAGGRLLLYGPFILDGEPTAASNLAFDAELRGRDPAWGLRRLHEVEREAALAGLRLTGNLQMPANNRLLVIALGA
jgi:hypothetical protein